MSQNAASERSVKMFVERSVLRSEVGTFGALRGVMNRRSCYSLRPCTPPSSHPPGEKPRVLIIDDDDDTREVLAEALCIQGCEVTSFDDGAELVRLIEDTAYDGSDPTRFDAIVTDQCMPATTGLELLRIVRARGWSTPVLLMSGLADPRLRARALELGAFGVLEKPFGIDTFVRAVKNALKLGLIPAER